MAKNSKKKNRKLRRQIRKTIGALFMVSAITVAAIPVQDVNADQINPDIELFAAGIVDGGAEKVKVLNMEDATGSSYEKVNGEDVTLWHSMVPYVPDTAQIYTDYTMQFQFAFIRPAGQTTEVAVILGSSIGTLDNGELVIPSEMDAYKRISATTSDESSLCAVSKSNEILYYNKLVDKMEGNYVVYTVPDLDKKLPPEQQIGEITAKDSRLISDDGGKTYKFYYEEEIGKDDDGNPIMGNVAYNAVPATEIIKQPCYRNEYNTWVNAQLYYKDGDVYKESSPTDDVHGRIHNATVAYIGRQYLENDKIKGKVTSANPEKGVFAGNGNIKKLTIPKTLLGIGDFAFYRCSAINSVELGNGLNTIGNGAFASCINMVSCNLDSDSNINVIGREAFSNCTKLEHFNVPNNVDAIGDYCFKDCTSLKTIDMSGGINIENYHDRNSTQLTTIGINAFVNCTVLDELTFPAGCKEQLPIAYFAGCANLRKITSLDRTGVFDIVEDDKNSEPSDHTTCNIAEFLNKTLDKAVRSDFYFESFGSTGQEDTALHKTATDHSAAFSYLDNDGNVAGRFEKKVHCSENPSHLSKFVVNKNNELIEMEIDPDCGEINIPASIGGYGILKIAARGFAYNCNLKRIVIPSTINTIGEYAFVGCHNLKDVIFLSPINSNLIIEQGAFDTQDAMFSSGKICGTCDAELAATPVLTFTGEIFLEDAGKNSAPFEYAMNAANNINVGSQTKDTYITYYSGWPSNLTVKYNPERELNELINYPRFEDLAKYTADSYPDMTDERAKAAKNAKENYPKNANQFTQDEWDIIHSALEINLPYGIEGIASGIFSGVDSENEEIELLEPNNDIISITMNSIKELEPYTFAGLKNLTRAYDANGLEKVGDYAFINCPALSTVNLGSSVTALGKRPFAKCRNLESVDFVDNPNFICDSAIIYGLTDGARSTIIECLEARGNINARIGPDELAGITSIADEAFKDCDGVGTINLTATSIKTIPEQCFAQTDNLGEILLPESLKSIGKGAFWNSNVFYVDFYPGITYIEPEAFANVEEDEDGDIILDEKGNPIIKNEKTGHKKIQFRCTDDDAASVFAEQYYYIEVDPYVPTIKYTVNFWDDYEDEANPNLLDRQKVNSGDDAVPPVPPVHDGVTFTGWRGSYEKISKDTDIYAKYGNDVYKVTFQCSICGESLCEPQYIEAGKSAKEPTYHDHTSEGLSFSQWKPDYHDINAETNVSALYTSDNMHIATFYDEDGITVIAAIPVMDGGTVYPPAAPTKSGKKFVGWKPADYTNITKDRDYFAFYEDDASASPSGGNANASPSGSNASAAPSGSNNNNGNNNASATPSATPEPSPGVKKYTVSVSGGSGSGQYAAGEIVALNAYFMGSGQNFDKWTTSTAGVGFANPNASSTTFTMPAANVAITATYTTGSGSSAASSSGGSGSSGNRNTGGSSVQVDRPGISNEGLAGATVSGSTDNFIVKVTEDQNATNAVVSALQARYGDISRIKYLAMDISLYDSTGRTKIVDTSGISVNLTLPIPDDLVQYAGNNKAAAIANGSMEDLNVRFTTVDGVPCINFTATHFSPYVIYVDTANLTESTIDATPKTGDPIHPKWFLAMGMACISLILFFKRDKVVVAKTA